MSSPQIFRVERRCRGRARAGEDLSLWSPWFLSHGYSTITCATTRLGLRVYEQALTAELMVAALSCRLYRSFIGGVSSRCGYPHLHTVMLSCQPTSESPI